MQRRLTMTQKALLSKFATGELNGSSRAHAGTVAICRNLQARGLLAVDATLTDAGREALTTGTYSTVIA